MKPIPDFPGYFADEDGAIWSEKRGKLKKLKFRQDKDGYNLVQLCNGKRHDLRVARTMLLTYKGIPRNCVDFDACHENGIRSDDRIINLRWDTHVGNMKDVIKARLKKMRAIKKAQKALDLKPVYQTDDPDKPDFMPF